MRTAVVILNWNTKSYLERFLPTLLASVPDWAEVIVADNASDDGSPHLLAEKFPQVRLVRLDRNHGFTGGYNRALASIASLPEAGDLEHFVLINSDIEVTSHWLEPLALWMDEHPDCAACGPKLLSWHDRKTFEYAGAAGGLLDRLGYPFCRGRVLGRTEEDLGQYDTPAQVFWVSGACLMVRKEAYSMVGGLDGRFFAHQEEIDLCWRLALEGLKVHVVPQSVVYHIGGGTLPSTSPLKLKLNFRNNLLMLQNNLAKTLALKALASGHPLPKAARRGLRLSRWTVFKRLCLDGCSAAVYILTLRPALFKAVLQAHKEFRSLKSSVGLEGLLLYLQSHKGVSAPELYPRWIIPLALVKGGRVFDHFRKTP